MVDPSVTSLYRKVVSPSVKFQTEGLQKETHARHIQYGGRSSLALRHLAASPTINVTQLSRNTYSAPGRVENRNTLSKRTKSPGAPQENRVTKEGNYDFHPTTRFKTTSLPAMPMTSRYAQSLPGTSRTVALSVPRHSAMSLPDKMNTADINPRILFTSQKQRQSVERQAKSECRRLKRKSEIIAHRVDRHYYLCGNQLPVKNKWDVDANDLMKLKLLAHHKQLAQYQAMKESEIHNSRDSPSGQMSSPTPSGKENSGFLSSGQQSPRESEGKWAEETKSETSSIDDVDMFAMRGRRIKQQGSTNNQAMDKLDDSKVSEGQDQEETKDDRNDKSNESTNHQATDKLDDSEVGEGQNQEENKNDRNDKSNENDNTFITETTTVNEANNEQDSQKDNQSKDEVTDKMVKASSSKSAKKVKNLRFQDEVMKKSSNQRRAKSCTNKDDKKDEEKNDKENSKEDHVNPYMDDWLGIKKKEVDGRYKPGKPPPNRIFISSEISKSKSKQVAKFSNLFLTETISLHEKQVHDDTEQTPEIRFGIIGDKQKEAFQAMFNEVDKDKNGSVTLEELKLKMMPGVSRDDIKHFVQVFDLNKDKTVDSREFIAICCLNDTLAGTRTETADGSIALELEKLAQHIVIFKEMYKTMDEDDDNRLDVNEVLVIVSAAMETEMGADLTDARRVLSDARDQFGYIDFVGFMSYIPFFAKLLRAIMQNPLSINDIEKARERVKQKELTFKPKTVTKKEPKSWEAY